MSDPEITIGLCGNVDCQEQGSETLWQELHDHPIPNTSINRIGCCDACGHGPCAVIYKENKVISDVLTHCTRESLTKNIENTPLQQKVTPTTDDDWLQT